MADEIGTKVSQLPLGENLGDSDLMYAVEGGISKKVEVGYLKNRFVGDLTLADLGDDSTHRLVTDAEKTAWNSKADESDIPTTLAELGDDSTHRLVTDTEKAAWDAKANVEANPLGEATAELTKIGINNTIYKTIGGEKVYGEASGAIASFSDGSNNPLVKLEADINPIQDLHGYDKPWADGCGKNKFKNNFTTKTESGVTFTSDSDGTIRLSGNASTMTDATIENNLVLPVGSYILNGCPSGGGVLKYRLWVRDNTTATYYNDDGSGVSFEIEEEHTYRVEMRVWTGYGNGLVFKPMIRLATETDATFAPYTNICPISGRSSVEVTVADDTTDTATEETYEISLGQTVYGGKLNVTTGELTVDRVLAEYDGSIDETWSYVPSYGGFRVTIADANIDGIPSEQVISNRFEGSTIRGAADKDIPGKMLAYTSTSDNIFLFFTTAITDLSEWKDWLSENITQVEYPLATPTTVTLTPTQISSLLGSNNIWADSGDSDVVYIRDLNLFLTQLDARVKALENA